MSDNRNVITLACGVCGSRNHTVSKAKRQKSVRLETMKHCPKCRQHTLHQETK